MSQSLKSPRLQQLVTELTNGTESALASFWQEVKSAGSPFVEPVEIIQTNEDGEEETVIDDQHVWVTFLYEGDSDTEHVSLRAAFMHERKVNAPDDHAAQYDLMHHLENTNIWYWTQKLRKTCRLQYFMPANHELVPSDEYEDRFPTEKDKREYAKTIDLPDPLNPEQMFFDINPNDPDSEAPMILSVFSGSEAEPQPHIDKREGVPKGEVSSYKWESDIFDDHAYNWVYLPPGYDEKREAPYHLLVIFDGFTYIGGIRTPVILDNLLAEGKIPPTVALCIGNFKERRIETLVPNEDYPQALTDEILPYLRENYHITDDPQQTIIGGSSLGGLSSAWNAFKLPHIFGNVLSQSGSFWWSEGLVSGDDKDDKQPGWLIRQYLASEALPINFYMDVGTEENKDYWTSGFSHQSMNRHMRDVLLAKGYDVHYREYDGGHDYCWWRQTLADGLIHFHQS